MSAIAKRATIYFEPLIHKALRLKAAETSCSISDLVNSAVRYLLKEDAEDLEAFEARRHEPDIRFEQVLKELKAHGKL